MSASQTAGGTTAVLPAGASPSPTPGSSLASAGTPVVDPLAASALCQVASSNDQLATSVDSLTPELRTRAIDTGAISATLRAMSAAATYGSSVVGYLSAWPEAATLQGQVALRPGSSGGSQRPECPAGKPDGL